MKLRRPAVLGIALASAIASVAGALVTADTAPAIVGGRPVISGGPAGGGVGLASVHTRIRGNWVSNCSGSVVAPRWVLTAKHCLSGRMAVRVASLDRSRGGRLIRVVGVRRHPRADLVLMHLARPTPGRLVRLGSKEPRLRREVRTYGWGVTCSRCDMSRRLKTVRQRVTGKRTVAGTGRLVITNGKGGHACNGDSGGPLFAYRDGKRWQVGVVAIGFCNSWTGHVSVAAYRNWIRRNTGR